MSVNTKTRDAAYGLEVLAPVRSDRLTQDEITRTTLEAFGQAFVDLDIDAVMDLFAEDAVYYDVVGPAPNGNMYRGKPAIRKVFEAQFRTFPTQTFRDIEIFVEGNKACSAFVYTIGNKDNETTFRGHDYLEVNAAGKVTLKRATIKGISEMNRKALFRHPVGILKYLFSSKR